MNMNITVPRSKKWGTSTPRTPENYAYDSIERQNMVWTSWDPDINRNIEFLIETVTEFNSNPDFKDFVF